MKDKLLKGYKVGDMTYKVHLDGDNLVPYLTGQAPKSPRESFFYVNDDQQLVALRYDNWKLIFMEQEPREHCSFGQTPSRPCGFQKCSTSGRIRMSAPTSPQTPIGTGLLTTPTLVPAQDYVGQFLATFRDYPQRQKAATFNLDEVMQKLKEGSAK